MLFLLIILLILVLLMNYAFNGHAIISPAVLFSASFVWGCAWALINQDKWNLKLHLNTFLIILGSAIVFSLVAFLVHVSWTSQLESNSLRSENGLKNINIAKWKIVALVLIEIITIVYSIHEIKLIVPASTLSESIYSYRSQAIDPVRSLTLRSFPEVLSLLRFFVGSLGYYFIYIFIKKKVYFSQLDYACLTIFVLCILNSFLVGSRGSAVMMIICALVYWYILSRKNSQLQGRIKLSKIFLVIGIFVVIIFSFQALAALLGRSVDQFSTGNYLSIYMGAEIKNLDEFLHNNIIPIGQSAGQSQTFINLMPTLSRLMGWHIPQYSLDLPFTSVNGYSLGNVYTCLYPYLYDFGYIGALLLVGGIAFISQISFEAIKKIKVERYVSLAVLIYAKIAVSIIFSFFSNKFYEDIFNLSFLKMVLVWVILDWFLWKKSWFEVQKKKDVA